MITPGKESMLRTPENAEPHFLSTKIIEVRTVHAFFFPRNAKARNLQQPVTTGPKSIELVGRCCFSQDNVSTASNPAGRSNLSNVSTICSGEDRNLKCHRRCQETSLGFRGEL
ncbi:unnamed protein product [Cladocopium goreaui]|uniref:Uncharacterized protein n=1 Tax=Cladocopium goreaui TaxID=2562237 RepID=A0A9P1FRU6_9DINO|nr:unnamed protein product [Cladocopium goreaui]